MSALRKTSQSDFEVSSLSPTHNHGRRCKSTSPITLRLTPSERERLDDLAKGMTLSAYIRACVFEKEDKRRKRRSTAMIGDKKAIAQILAMLGQSRIANNLNQLAYQANLGTLEMDDVSKTHIEEAYIYIYSIRDQLLKALAGGQ